MPIDPRIAMSFKPTYELESPQNIEANVMKLQNAKYANELARMQSQEYSRGMQEQEGLRNYLAGRPDLSSQEAQSELTRFGKTGLGMLESAAKLKKEKTETQAKSEDVISKINARYKSAFDAAESPAQLATVHSAMFNDEVLGPILKAMGRTPDSGLVAIQNAKTPEDFYGLKLRMGEGTAKFLDASKNQILQQVSGTGTRMVAFNPLTNQLTVVPGSESQAAIPPGQQVTQDIARQRLGIEQSGLELRQQEAARKAAGQDLKPVPVPIQKAITGSAATIAKLDRAIQSITDNPNATGYKGLLPDIALNRLYSEGTEGRANVADIGSLEMHERSGAAVTASEAPRLRPFIPLITDDHKTVLKKLNRMREIQAEEQDALLGTYNPEQGFREFKPATVTKPSAPNAPVVPKRDLKSMSNEDLLRELSKPNG